LLQAFDGSSREAKEMVFGEQIGKMRYHFLRKGSELNQLEHPEWVFKHLKDQVENASLRLQDA